MTATTSIRILGQGTMTASGHRFWLVTSSSYETTNRAYIVEQHPGHLTCNCPARKPCKHIKLVAEHINAERKEAAQPASVPEQAIADDDLYAGGGTCAECGGGCADTEHICSLCYRDGLGGPLTRQHYARENALMDDRSFCGSIFR